MSSEEWQEGNYEVGRLGEESLSGVCVCVRAYWL